MRTGAAIACLVFIGAITLGELRAEKTFDSDPDSQSH